MRQLLATLLDWLRPLVIGRPFYETNRLILKPVRLTSRRPIDRMRHPLDR